MGSVGTLGSRRAVERGGEAGVRHGQQHGTGDLRRLLRRQVERAPEAPRRGTRRWLGIPGRHADPAHRMRRALVPGLLEVAPDPLRLPLRVVEESRLPVCRLAPLARRVVLVPHAHAPPVARTRRESRAAVGNVRRLVAFHASAVPRVAFGGCGVCAAGGDDDLVGRVIGADLQDVADDIARVVCSLRAAGARALERPRSGRDA